MAGIFTQNSLYRSNTGSKQSTLTAYNPHIDGTPPILTALLTRDQYTSVYTCVKHVLMLTCCQSRFN